jgi:two-component system response regulator AtoC
MQDVPALVDHFIAHYNARFGRKIEGVDPAALAHLASYSWPGNVRELQNVIERAMILEHEARITLGSLVTEANPTRAPDAQLDSSLEGLPYREYMEVATARVQRTYVERALARNQGNVTRTAEALGLERETLHRILKKLGLRADEFRA